MLTPKEYYLSRRNKCLLRAIHAHSDDASALWREIAESYRILGQYEEREEEQKKSRALL